MYRTLSSNSIGDRSQRTEEYSITSIQIVLTMERHAPLPCDAPTNKSFRRRMEEKSEWLKQTRGKQNVQKDTTKKERTPVHAVEELDNLHRKWRDEQFHFDDHRTESIEPRDEDSGLREHASETVHSNGSSVSMKLKSARHRRRVNASSNMQQSFNDDERTEGTGPLHKHDSSKATPDLTVSNIWKERHLDESLESMIQKLQKQNDPTKRPARDKKSDKAKEEKRKKLLSLLIDIKQKMEQKALDSESLLEKEKSGKRVSFQLNSPRAADTLETTSESKESIRVDNSTKRTHSTDMEEYTVIPKDVLTEMQKLLNAHRTEDSNSSKVSNRSALRPRLPSKSILDAIPEHKSIAFLEAPNNSNANESPKLESKKAKGKDERLRRVVDKQRHVAVDGMVDRAVDFLTCGQMKDLVLPSRKSGNSSLGFR